MSATTGPGLVDIRALARLPHLHVAARAVVDGMQAGIHRSQRKGQSVDFADHRPYVGGDDTRHLDWKVLGRSDRLVIRRYEAESDLTCWLLVDGSASMAYQGRRAAAPKFRYAAICAATMAWLVIEQHDRVGLHIAGDQAPPSAAAASRRQFEACCARLQGHASSGEERIHSALEQLAGQSLRRGLLLVFSDLVDDPEAIAAACDRLVHRGQSVALVWVLDPDEVDLGCDDASAFVGLENDGELTVDPRAVRRAYREAVASHRHALQGLCQQRGIPLIACTTTDSPQIVLHRLLTELQR